MKRSAKGSPEITERGFPRLELPLRPPFPPMEAKRLAAIPSGEGWIFEPKWDGFRALIFRSGSQIAIQSKAGQPLARYFPEIAESFLALRATKFVIDGEIVIPIGGRLSFDDLLLRIHPAESRIRKLAESSPAHYFAFDLLVDRGRDISRQPLRRRRAALEKFLASADVPRIHLSPATADRKIAAQWFSQFGSLGLDGVMAKRIDEPYHSGEREGMVKIKNFKTADCVVGGFRYGEGTRVVGSLLLGLYDEQGRLVFVGHTSSIKRDARGDLTKQLQSLRAENPFEVRVPGGPSRWASERTGDWHPVQPKLVCEVEYDYFSQGRFRHGSKFLRWRPEKKPQSCTMEQVLPAQTGRKRGALATFFEPAG